MDESDAKQIADDLETLNEQTGLTWRRKAHADTYVAEIDESVLISASVGFAPDDDEVAYRWRVAASSDRRYGEVEGLDEAVEAINDAIVDLLREARDNAREALEDYREAVGETVKPVTLITDEWGEPRGLHVDGRPLPATGVTLNYECGDVGEVEIRLMAKAVEMVEKSEDASNG